MRGEQMSLVSRLRECLESKKTPKEPEDFGQVICLDSRGHGLTIDYAQANANEVWGLVWADLYELFLIGDEMNANSPNTHRIQLAIENMQFVNDGVLASIEEGTALDSPLDRASECQ